MPFEMPTLTAWTSFSALTSDSLFWPTTLPTSASTLPPIAVASGNSRSSPVLEYLSSTLFLKIASPTTAEAASFTVEVMASVPLMSPLA